MAEMMLMTNGDACMQVGTSTEVSVPLYYGSIYDPQVGLGSFPSCACTLQHDHACQCMKRNIHTRLHSACHA